MCIDIDCMIYKCCEGKSSLKKATKTAEALKLIAEENRLKILCMLKCGELCVCEIWQGLGISQNLVSHHLKVLKEAGFIDVKRNGLKMIYSINKKKLKEFVLLFNNYFDYD